MEGWRGTQSAAAEGASPLPWRCILETNRKPPCFSIHSFPGVLDSAYRVQWGSVLAPLPSAAGGW